jgi:ATP-dependent DNA helicase RecQ
VRHPAWGPGTVGRVQDDRLTVVFDDIGYKTLDLDLVLDRDLLENESPSSPS